MIINNTKDKRDIIGGTKRGKFTIDEDTYGIVMESLINMYSNPILSMIREIISNAIDAVRERDLIKQGKIEPDDGYDPKYFGDKYAVEVDIIKKDGILNDKDKVIIVDYGVGISPKRMEKIFSSFGKSTKRDSNILIGGFGLGAKSPLAYTETFYITTCVSEIKYKYIITRNNDKIEYVLVDERKVSNRNYTIVEIPIEKQDVTIANNVLSFYDTMIDNIIYLGNKEKHEVNILFDNNKVRILKINEVSNTVYEYRGSMYIDKIPYNIDTYSLSNYKADNIDNSKGTVKRLDSMIHVHCDNYVTVYNDNIATIKPNTYMEIILAVPKFSIGEIDLTRSRDDILINKKNITVIAKRIEEAIDSIIDKLTEIIQKIISNDTTKEIGELILYSLDHIDNINIAVHDSIHTIKRYINNILDPDTSKLIETAISMYYIIYGVYKYYIFDTAKSNGILKHIKDKISNDIRPIVNKAKRTSKVYKVIKKIEKDIESDDKYYETKSNMHDIMSILSIVLILKIIKKSKELQKASIYITQYLKRSDTIADRIKKILETEKGKKCIVIDGRGIVYFDENVYNVNTINKIVIMINKKYIDEYISKYIEYANDITRIGTYRRQYDTRSHRTNGITAYTSSRLKYQNSEDVINDIIKSPNENAVIIVSSKDEVNIISNIISSLRNAVNSMKDIPNTIIKTRPRMIQHIYNTIKSVKNEIYRKKRITILKTSNRKIESVYNMMKSNGVGSIDIRNARQYMMKNTMRMIYTLLYIHNRCGNNSYIYNIESAIELITYRKHIYKDNTIKYDGEIVKRIINSITYDDTIDDNEKWKRVYNDIYKNNIFKYIAALLVSMHKYRSLNDWYMTFNIPHVVSKESTANILKEINKNIDKENKLYMLFIKEKNKIGGTKT